MRTNVLLLGLCLSMVLSVTCAQAQQSSAKVGQIHFLPDASLGESPHHVFVAGDSPELNLVLLMTTGRLAEEGTLRYTVRDFWGHAVESGEIDVDPGRFGLGGKILLEPKVRAVGWYSVEFDLIDPDGPVMVEYLPTSAATNEREPIATFAIVPPRRTDILDSPFGIDTFMALYDVSKSDTLADLLYLSGVTWVRDRFRWNQAQPSGPDQALEWGRYGVAAEAVDARGLNMLYVFETAPAWVRQRGSIRLPDDLMAVHRAVREAADTAPSSMLAWEFWNEQDWTFSVEPADHYAAALKAAALGFRKAEVPPLVALGPLALEPGSYAELLFENGITPYLDIHSFHTYADATNSRYEATLDKHLTFVQERGLGGLKIWITESGRPFSQGPVQSFMDEATAQVEYLVKAYVKSLAAGVDRFFWFPLPHMMEKGNQLGTLRADLTPLPAFSALATLTSTLGQGTYVGRSDVDGASIYLFDTGNRVAAVAWNDRPGSIRIPAQVSNDLRVVDVMGGVSAAEPTGSVYELPIQKMPVYLDGLDLAAWPYDVQVPEPKPPLPTSGEYDLNIVLLARFDSSTLPANRDAAPMGYLVRAGESVTFTVEVYNFGDDDAEGVIAIDLPDGFTTDSPQAVVVVPAMSKAEVEFTFTAARRLPLADHKLRIEATMNGRPVTPSVLRLLERR